MTTGKKKINYYIGTHFLGNFVIRVILCDLIEFLNYYLRFPFTSGKNLRRILREGAIKIRVTQKF